MWNPEIHWKDYNVGNLASYKKRNETKPNPVISICILAYYLAVILQLNLVPSAYKVTSASNREHIHMAEALTQTEYIIVRLSR